MRVAGIVFAILLIAACPPRRARVVYVYPSAVPCATVTAPPAPTVTAKPVDPVVEGHLLAWEKKIASTNNLRVEISLKRTDAVFKRDWTYSGVVLCMKPNYAILRLDNNADPKKIDYEAYICDGKSVYMYDGNKKTITEFKLPAKESLGSFATHNPALAMLAEPNAKNINERFDVTLFKTDEHYIYLDIKPRASKDVAEFKHARLALYGPNTKHAYLPAQLYVLKPNEDTEAWKFTNPQVDIPYVKADVFKFSEVPKGWKVEKAVEK